MDLMPRRSFRAVGVKVAFSGRQLGAAPQSMVTHVSHVHLIKLRYLQHSIWMLKAQYLSEGQT